MKKITFEELKPTLTKEQIEAVKTCHNALFYAEMSDDYSTTLREEKAAIDELKKYFPNLINFKADFYNGNDTLIFIEEE